MATGSLLLMLLHHGGLTWSQSGSQRYLVPPKGCHLLSPTAAQACRHRSA